ncbi:MAG: PfkB family carbohydrate kinase [Gammaproteobacteria bacterium]
MSGKHRPPRVVGVGNASIDVVFGVDRLLERAGKHFAHRHFVGAGGVASNGLVAAARLGARAALIGRVGDDDWGRRIIEELERGGVDTAYVARRAGVGSAVSTVIVDNRGERQILNYTDPVLFAGTAGACFDAIDGADCVLADLRWPAGLSAALERARDLGLPALIDFDLSPDTGTEVALELATHIVFSQPALARMTGKSAPADGLEALSNRTRALIGVTAGEQGAYWLEAGELMHQPAFEVDARDTTGAGDVFHGALALAIAEGWSAPEGMRFAAAAAAIKCTGDGVRRAMPDRATVDTFLRCHRDGAPAAN